MKSVPELISEIIDGAIATDISVAALLRKCWVVSAQFENDSLTEWVLKELNGYDDWKNLPNYRVINVGAKGFFIGPLSAQINDQPLASLVLDEDHRHFAESVFLRDPVSAYENVKDDGDGRYRVEWPANLVLKYQSSFFEGYALNRAWQEVPAHALRSIAETVRNRVLEFALSMRKEFGDDITEVDEVVNEHIDSVVLSILNPEKADI